ncbi:MAG: helix-turn-helix domain-containing protein [Streptomycetaceae bacterium]|nr:helix-turn-helix domain-containing protein [Streptomycetaceae bacterium]
MARTDSAPIADTTATGPVTSVSTDPLPPAERLSWWNEMVGREVMPVAIRCAYGGRFHGVAEVVESPDSQVATFTFSPMSAKRSPLQIRRRDPEAYFLILAHGTPIRLEQDDRAACLGVGDMALFSSSHPLTCDFVDLGRYTELTLVRLSRAGLPLRNGRADRLLGETLRADSADTALLAGYLTRLPDAARSAGPTESAKLAAIALDLVATVLAVRLGAQDALPTETRTAALLTRIRTIIDLHLGDPGLDPAAVAAQHHISVRTLHSLFRGEPETVAASIKRRRLERCHADLLDPALRRRSIADIARRWGFRHPGDFTRAYRAAYGHPPSETRNR